jgi:ABC-2 type transport system permease protein
MIRAEVRKLLTVRGTWLLFGIPQLVVVGGVSGLMLQRDDPTSVAGQQGAIGHVGLVSLFALLLGVIIVAGEYRHRTITDAFLAVPRRSRLLAAKLVVALGGGLALGLLSAVTALVTTAIWLAAKGATLSGGGVWRTVLGGIGWNVAFAALGVGLGALIANLLAAVVAALAWLALVEGIVGQLVGGGAKWLPFALGTALEGRGGPSPWQAALALTAYAAVFVAAGVVATDRRDIT